jgi:hypothetical protein
MRVVLTMTPGTEPHPRQRHCAAVASPSTTTCSAPSANPRPYKSRRSLDDFCTPTSSPLPPEPPRPLPLSDYTPPHRNLAGARRRSSSTPPTIPSTPGAATTLIRLVVIDNVDRPPRRPRRTPVSPSPRPLCRRLGLELVGARPRRG